MTQTRPPLLAPDELAEARRRASRTRAEWLVAITEGVVTVDDLIRAACEPDGKPLMKISLSQLLLAQPGVGKAKAERVLRKTHTALSGRGDDSQPLQTVANLVDPRSGGRRYVAFRDALSDRQTPVTGFPFAPLVHDEAPAFTQGHLGNSRYGA
ncbi:hypothetical protein [Aeromicrobium sp. 179-A 4D2 NHS]|uniref:hypothetical protein n=1 Tax=Aeromicrobium sp. 179-A 4D2 NHS TaxID=3142375 RepID=UPI0039A375A6